MPGKKIPESRRREQILEAAYRVALQHRLSGLSSRAVAAEAGVSNGLVFFYFRDRRELLLALLDSLLAKTILRRAKDRGGSPTNAAKMLAAEIRHAIEGLPRDRKRIELFFDYWFMGAQDEIIRERIRAALKLFRDSYLPLAKSAVAEHPGRFRGIGGESLADAVTNFIEGCALRLIVEPRHYNVKSYSDVVAVLMRE
jgi:TetR/AcrR family transcriptional regulator, transcriptional repressor of bet genes